MTMRRLLAGTALAVFALVGCQKPQPLTAEKAQEIVAGWSFRREPVYAEVPQKVWWSPKAPKDDYDEKAVRTLRNLEKARSEERRVGKECRSGGEGSVSKKH